MQKDELLKLAERVEACIAAAHKYNTSGSSYLAIGSLIAALEAVGFALRALAGGE